MQWARESEVELSGKIIQGWQVDLWTIKAAMVLSSESPLDSASGRDLGGHLEKDSVRSYYNQIAGSNVGNKGSRNYQVDAPSEIPWGAPGDIWEHEESLMDTQGQMQLNFLDQSKVLGGHSQSYEGTGDSLRMEATGVTSANQSLHNMMMPVTTHSLHASTVAESPHHSGLSKDNSDREVKQEMRAESSDGSDPMDDDDDKGGARSGRRHLSKNLVAERKRRKKLNERLYSLRALVPKITKMDRASILGDAIEYVKELQQQVKELQDELLLDSKQGDVHLTHADKSQDDGHAQQVLEDGKGVPLGDAAQTDQMNVSMETVTVDRKIDDLDQPMQVEVNKMDGHLFSLRIFCEKRPGVFVKLMQALDVLGLDIIHANITSFRGLVLNVLNAESHAMREFYHTLIQSLAMHLSPEETKFAPPRNKCRANVKDKDLLRADQVKESLLEMSLSGFRNSCLSGDSAQQPTRAISVNDKSVQ